MRLTDIIMSRNLRQYSFVFKTLLGYWGLEALELEKRLTRPRSGNGQKTPLPAVDRGRLGRLIGCQD
jgi:hypothetical protein